ncbi:ATP-binding cassette domain-containing protein [Alicyclobacillus contaminans]|uniref:ATP-binding cassette domain-containing protein n=1 Tax=Alicyclobacillus contaminans TaxID=392016 RepID=UPI0004126953|nr:ATP-binding cassette domain-containing protein [Alicyclobacillus contaminans]
MMEVERRREHQMERRGAPLLRLSDVTIAYPDAPKPAVRDVSLTIRAGETWLLLGPSGCGKSTLAMLCGGLIPSAVEARVEGHVEKHPGLAATGAVGYVFQDPEAQFCMFHVDDEVAFGLENQRCPADEMPDRIRRALAAVRLDVPMTAEHAVFSGGMKQKLAIASALVMQPQLLIYDEPTANLDPASSKLVFEQLVRLREAGQTQLIIEHKFMPLLPHVDGVVLFAADGRVRRCGPAREVLAAEWPWLKEAGVVPPWQSSPYDAAPQPRVSRRFTPLCEPAAASFAEGLDADSPAEEPLISGHGLSLKYGDHIVWRDVDVTVPAGAFIAIVGPNGAGKSSLLQVLAGLTRPSQGQLLWRGRPLEQWPQRARQSFRAFGFQNPEHQFIYERVGDELANRVLQDGVPPDVASLLEQFGLSGLADRSPYALSQGQKRRLSVAAMIKDPHEVYLLDEPTFGQDAKTQAAMMESLKRLQQAGKTVVMTTHDMDLVRAHATEVWVMCDGRLTFCGPPSTLFERPDVMAEAHLLAEVEEIPRTDLEVRPVEAEEQTPPGQSVGPGVVSRGVRGVARRLNPSVHLLAVLAAVLLEVGAHTLTQTAGLFAWSLVLLVMVPRLGPLAILKRLSPFIGFYVLYVWSFVAFSAVPPGVPTFHLLWFHLSWTGLHTGVVLAFRMLAAVGLGLLLVSSTEITAMILSLCQNLRLAPKFAYGLLAGLRLAPLFQQEWIKLHQARQLRGKDARWSWLRPVTYALPLLTQAVRMSERIATAMEARGFVGAASTSVAGRTFYRPICVRMWDVWYGLCVPGVALILVLWLH